MKKRRGEKENLTYILDDETKELLNKYGDISKEDKDYLLAIFKESTNYEGFVAVMYSVINRAVKNNKTIAEIVSMPNQYEAFKASEIGVMSEQKNEVWRAIEDVSNGQVNNPIKDCTNYFGRYYDGNYNLWIEDYENAGTIILVGGNIFYTDSDLKDKRIHNKFESPMQYDASSLIVWNHETKEWINGSDSGVIKVGK